MKNQNEELQEKMYMQEEELLDDTFGMLEKSGASDAYEFLVSHKGDIKEPSSQMYNYLYCLGALAEKKEEALGWLREAVEDRGFWYRSEVFEDSDLDSLRDEEIFVRCKKISDERYYSELEKAKTICTWKGVTAEKLALVLHGNQQNIDMCKEHWEKLSEQGYQVEYVQSKILDSYRLYRWDDDAQVQLNRVVEGIRWDEYDSRVLCGFSAGCNEILKALKCSEIKCEGIVLMSPWIPVIESGMDEIMERIRGNLAWVKLVCGTEDEDCLPLAEKFTKAAEQKGISVSAHWIEGMGHRYPDDFILKYL